MTLRATVVSLVIVGTCLLGCRVSVPSNVDGALEDASGKELIDLKGAGYSDHFVADQKIQLDHHITRDIAAAAEVVSSMACPSDQFNNNHDPETAAKLFQTGWVTNLIVCPGQEDWFIVDIPNGYWMQFEPCTESNADTWGLDHNPVDIDMHFFQEEVPQIITSDTADGYHLGHGLTSAGNCFSTGVRHAPRRYYFRIAARKPRPTSYQIHLYLEPIKSQTCDIGDGVVCEVVDSCSSSKQWCLCRTDAYEPNDTPALAKPFPLGVAQDLYMCPTDDDWYEVDTNGKTTLKIHLKAPALLDSKLNWTDQFIMDIAVFSPQHLNKPIEMFPLTVPWFADYVVKLPAAGKYLLRAREAYMARDYRLSVMAQ